MAVISLSIVLALTAGTVGGQGGPGGVATDIVALEAAGGSSRQSLPFGYVRPFGRLDP
jgi:hypothetical protein